MDRLGGKEGVGGGVILIICEMHCQCSLGIRCRWTKHPEPVAQLLLVCRAIRSPFFILICTIIYSVISDEFSSVSGSKLLISFMVHLANILEVLSIVFFGILM